MAIYVDALKRMTANVDECGFLDTGTGSLDLVEIKDGELVNCDCGDMRAYVYYKGKCYNVNGKKLAEEI